MTELHTPQQQVFKDEYGRTALIVGEHNGEYGYFSYPNLKRIPVKVYEEFKFSYIRGSDFISTNVFEPLYDPQIEWMNNTPYVVSWVNL